MCVLTYIPTPKGFIFTSNRDEKYDRLTLPPKRRIIGPEQMIFPLDIEHNGTWLSIDPKKQQIACLINAKGPQPNPKEKISRGHMPFQFLIDETKPSSKTLVNRVAPFTLIKVDYNNLMLKEFKWDGHKLKSSVINQYQPELWCSNSLYSDAKKNKLKADFMKYINKTDEYSNIIDFHKAMAQPLNSSQYSIKDKNIQTVSITSIIFEGESLDMNYLDILNQNKAKFLQL